MDEIKRLYQEAAAALAKGRAILDEFKGKELPQDKAAEADKHLNEAQEKTERAKQLEKAQNLDTYLNEGQNRLNAFQEGKDGKGNGQPAKVTWNGRELLPEEVEELKSAGPLNTRGGRFTGFLSANREDYLKYAALFHRYLCKGFGELSNEEQKALSVGEAQAGGYLMQDTQLTALLVKSREMSAMRRISRVLPPVPSGSLITPTEESALSDATWTTEVKTGALDEIKPFGDRRLTPHPLAKGILVSNPLLRVPGFDAEGYIRDRMAYKFAVPEENGFINGNGVGQALGIKNTPGLPTWTSAAALTVDGDDVINWVYSLPAAYAGGARILSNRAFIRKCRTMKTGLGDYVWQPGLQTGSPNRILDVPYEFSDRFDDGLDATDAWEANAVIAIIGDFSYYWVVDALQMSIQRLIELYAGSNQVGFIGRKETDGMAVLAEPFYALKVHA